MTDYPAVVEAAKISGLTRWLPLFVELDLTTPTALIKEASQLTRHGMQEAEIKALLIPLKGAMTKLRQSTVRSDLPQPQTSSGGSMERALQAAAPNCREAALAKLNADIYSRSNSGPHVSRMRTWTRLANAWHLPPMPITAELLRAIGASFKEGGYRSSHLYFSTAKKQHVLQFGSFSADLEVVMQDVIRSIERGQGPSKLKDSFSVHALARIDLQIYDAAFTVKWAMVILGCYFLTREIELAATLKKHLHLDTHKLIVTWTLPVSKTDPKGGLIARAHKCMCSTVPPPLCPYHTAYELQKVTYNPADPAGDGPLFSQDMEFMTKAQTIEAIREVLTAAGIATQRQGDAGMVERFHGHCLRVSGAQYLTQLKFSAQLVMLIGRWGSQAILRYIQDSPLAAMLEDEIKESPLEAPSQVPTQREDHAPAIKRLRSAQADTNTKMETMEAKITALAAEVSVINYTPKYIVGKKTHLPDTREKVLTPRSWVARCGWAYGMSRFRRTDEEGDKCRKCFQISDDPEPIAETGDSSSSDSSSS